jgi:hypothetical protein
VLSSLSAFNWHPLFSGVEYLQCSQNVAKCRHLIIEQGYVRQSEEGGSHRLHPTQGGRNRSRSPYYSSSGVAHTLALHPPPNPPLPDLPSTRAIFGTDERKRNGLHIFPGRVNLSTSCPCVLRSVSLALLKLLCGLNVLETLPAILVLLVVHLRHHPSLERYHILYLSHQRAFPRPPVVRVFATAQ